MDSLHAGARQLRTVRLRVGMTQQRLADLAGLHVRTIRGLETGHILNPRDASVDRIAQACALSVGEHLQFRVAWGLDNDTFAPIGVHHQRSDEDVFQSRLRRSQDRVHTVALNETIWIGPDRRTTHRDTQEVTLALADHVDGRTVFYDFLDEPIDLAGFHLSNLENCFVREELTNPVHRMKLFELQLDHPLLKGQSQVIRYSADFVPARTRLAATPPLAVQEIAGFLRSPASYLLEVRFHSSAIPAHCVQVFQANPDSPVRVMNSLVRTAEHAVHLALINPRPGGHGIAWSWPDQT